MKQANVFYKSHLAGVLTENDSGYMNCWQRGWIGLCRGRKVMMKNKLLLTFI